MENLYFQVPRLFFVCGFERLIALLLIQGDGCRNDPDYHGNVRHYLARAKKVHALSPTDDEAMLEHIEEILAEIGPQKARKFVLKTGGVVFGEDIKKFFL
jgi:hypothetical protein